MRVLVTGGCGFLGAWVVGALILRGHEVRVLDARPDPARLELISPGLGGRVELVAGDITDGKSVLEAAADCEVAIHLAGVMTVDCRNDPIRGAEINLLGSLHLFEAALAVGMKRVAYVSTAGVYGSDDGMHPRPMTHYGALKLALEGCARAYFVDHDLPSVGFRPYIIYGPGVSSGISAGPSIACRAAHEGTSVEIEFSGRVGLVHVEDVALAFATAVETELVGAAVCNIAGETATIDDFVGALKRAVPSADIKVTGPPLLIAPDLDASVQPDWFAALPVTGIEQGIGKTLAHYRRAAGGAAA